MKFVIACLLFAATASANPIVVFPNARIIQMTREDVHITVGRHSSRVEGDYAFAKVPFTARGYTDEYVRILLPVYTVASVESPDLGLSEAQAIYAPQLEIGGKHYEPRGVATSSIKWSSWWRGAKFSLLAFEYAIPSAEVPADFVTHITYTQPHLVARKVSYACYCPFRPIPREFAGQSPPDNEFKLTASAADGVKLSRVSRNKTVLPGREGNIVVQCRHLEDIVIRVESK
jgi:hypothetical protein